MSFSPAKHRAICENCLTDELRKIFHVKPVDYRFSRHGERTWLEGDTVPNVGRSRVSTAPLEVHPTEALQVYFAL